MKYITIHEALQQLAISELSQFGIADYSSGDIPLKNYPKIFPLLQRGIRRVFNDLGLRTGTLYLDLHTEVSTYTLSKEHTRTQGGIIKAIKNLPDLDNEFLENVPATPVAQPPVVIPDTSDRKIYYINDLNAPFVDDIYRIDQVTMGNGDDLPINVRNDLHSVAVPKANIIQFPFPKTGDVALIEYTATAPQLPEIRSLAAAKLHWLPLPDYALDALYIYILSLMTAGITRQQEIQDTQIAMERYMAEIQRILVNQPIVSDTEINTKLDQRGFV